MLTLISVIFFLLSLGSVSPPTCPKTSVITMALSLEDFIKISQEQRKEEQELRAQERAADLKEINTMIEKGVKEEVERVLAPIQVKNDERFTRLETQLSKLQEAPKYPPLPQPEKVFPPHPPPRQQTSTSPVRTMVSPLHSPATQSVDVKDTLQRVRRMISLQPIHKRRDVDRQVRTHDYITTDEQAMEAAVLEYCRHELKCQTVPTIVSIFPPANSTDFDRLYVEFEDENAASYVSGHARVIRKQDHQVGIYVPRNFQERFRAFNEHARMLRAGPGLIPGDIKTKVIYGRSDFILLTKPRNGRWTQSVVESSTFPPLQASLGPAPDSSSPPPGRPRGSPPPSEQPAQPPIEATQSPPPSSLSKRAASSPLESLPKAVKPSGVSNDDKTVTTPVPSSPQASPPHAQPLATSKEPAEISNPPEAACLATKQDQDQVKSGSVKSVLFLSSPDTGKFAQTAVCSPTQSTNKHFTFNSRRMSLPPSAGHTGQSLN